MIDDTFTTYQAREERAKRLKEEILAHNKGFLFAALGSAGITEVTIDFDGASDQGCFQKPMGFDGTNAEVPIPTSEITIKTVVFDTGVIEDAIITIQDYLEHLASDLLDEKHSYWEDDDGAYGTFRFLVTDQIITLEYNERYTASEYHEHHF
jgi:hypothetical protein